MIFERLHLKAFGGFTNRVLDFTSDGATPLHLVYGPNESGKSTCLRAIESFLFGMPRVLSDDYVHPYRKLRVGATLKSSNGESLSFIRRKSEKNSLFHDDDETPANESRLSDELGEMTRNEFRARFGLSYEQLVEGGKAVLESRGDLGEILFAAGAGIAQLQSIAESLDGESRALFLERGKKSTLNAAIRELDDKRKRLRSLQLPPSEYESRREAVADARAKSETLNESMRELGSRLGLLQKYREALEIIPVFNELTTKLESLGSVPALDEDFSARRREASARRSASQSHCRQHRQSIDELESSLAATESNEAILTQEAQIIDLFQQIATRESARRDQAGLRRVRNNHNRHLRDQLRELGLSVKDEAPTAEIDDMILDLRLSEGDQVRINELASEYARVRQQLDDSNEAVDVLRKQLSELDDELERQPAAPDSESIDTVLKEIGSPESWIKSLAQSQSECESVEFECQRILQNLRLSGMDLESVVTMAVPADTKLDHAEEELNNLNREQQTLKNRSEKASQALAASQAELRSQSGQLELPTEADLRTIRQQRDQAWLAIESSDEKIDAPTASDYRELVRVADDTVDKIRDHHSTIARRDAIASAISDQELELAASGRELAFVEQNIEQFHSKWIELLDSFGIPNEDIRSIRLWLQNHRRLADRYESLREARRRVDESQSSIHRGCVRLSSVIRLAASHHPIGVSAGSWQEDPDGSRSLNELHDLAISIRNELSESARLREMTVSKRADLLAAIPKAEATAETRRQQWSRWQQEWFETIKGVALQEETSPTVIHERLKRVTQMIHEQRERNIVQTRIESIDRDQEKFQQRVRSVAMLAGTEPQSEQSASEIAQALYEQLQSEKQRRAERDRLADQLERARERLVSDSRALDDAIANLTQLCEEAGAVDEESLRELEPRSAEKRKLVREVTQLRQDLSRIAGGEELLKFIAEAQSHETESLQHEIASLRQKLDITAQQARESDRHVGKLEQEFESVDGSDKAAALCQEMQFLVGRIHRDAVQFARLRTAKLLLRQSIEHYRQAHQNPVLELACHAFRGLTCGRYEGLKPDYDDKGQTRIYGLLQNDSDQEERVPVEAMSIGTADAVYLAMRLASIRHQLAPKGREVFRQFPVIIDDCLIQLDDQRTTAALHELATLASSTQVILFTHHRHLIDLANENLGQDQFAVHEL
ncbi:MAG: AAA family ATPase [Planctomycetota bacterium]